MGNVTERRPIFSSSCTELQLEGVGERTCFLESELEGYGFNWLRSREHGLGFPQSEIRNKRLQRLASRTLERSAEVGGAHSEMLAELPSTQITFIVIDIHLDVTDDVLQITGCEH